MSELINTLMVAFKHAPEDTVTAIYIMLGVVCTALFICLVTAFKTREVKLYKEVEKPKVEPKVEVETKVEEKVAEPKAEEPKVEEPKVEEVKVKKPEVEKPKGLSWAERLKKGLSRSNSEVWGKLGAIFTGKAIDDDTVDEIEELLYGADIGPTVVAELTDALHAEAKKGDFTIEKFKEFLFTFLRDKIAPVQDQVDTELYNFNPEKKGKTKVIMVVGVNGAGKTTTIGKLATKLTGQGAKVVVGACDTFRAAAVDQLAVWCDRAGATMIRAKEGANPSGVGYDALQEALNQEADYCILDTAGRLHTAGNLMDELTKSKNVLKKLDDSAPHQTLLVIDAITGQNALRQADEFNKALDLTGLIFTKCDGSSKAGSAIGIVQKLQVPISYIGVGETVEDLNVFDLDEYLKALLDH